MSVAAVLLPLFVEVALTFVLLFAMMGLRVGAIRQRGVNWPELQLSVLFYVLVILALFTRQADLLFVILSWLFVLSRIVHAVIHTGDNGIAPRFSAFSVGAVILLIMWIIFAVRILALSVVPPRI